MERSAGPPPDAPPTDEAPATREDLRNLRRWVAVAGVWAVAATAVAIIALVDEDGGEDQDAARDSAAQVSRVQRELDRRLDDLEERVQELPQSQDVRRLENRLEQAEERSSAAAGDAGRASDSVNELEQRVDELEQRVEEQESSNGGPPGQDGQQSP